MSYRILKITSFYKDFLSQIYNNHPELKLKSYSEQYQFLMDQKYAWSDFFKVHNEKLGVEVYEIIHNAEYLQLAWQRENHANEKNSILYEQIKRYKPDVLFFQDIKSFSGSFIKNLRNNFPFVKLIFGHCCSPYSALDIDNYQSYDFILTCLDSFKSDFEKIGIKSYKLDHAFEGSILDFVQSDNHFPKNDFIFIGSFVSGSDFHDNRFQYLEKLLEENIQISIYGNIIIDSPLQLFTKQSAFKVSRILDRIGLNSINQKIIPLKKVSTLKQMPKRVQISPLLRKSMVNETHYGINMYKLLSKAKIGLNIQAGVSGDYAVNMRLFETTGVGALLLTDYKKNIKDFFEPDYEIVTYNSVDECIEKSKWLFENPDKAEEIARAGQKRTLKDHALKDRFYKIHEIILENLK